VPPITVAELASRIRHPADAFVLDVREDWEFASGHVPSAHLIPLGELDGRLAEVPQDRPVYAICHSGQRSLSAAAYLLQRGYRDVSNVEGGTAAWIQQGLPLVR
jgi:rhodanese-related sulfurtransferase